MKTQMFRSASGAALLFCMAAAAPAFAQQAAPEQIPTPQADEPQADVGTSRVIVTGTNIVGSSESAALPVEVFTQEDNLKQGNQTALELVKSLTASGETLGEANIFIIGTQGYGSSNVNLRGLGGGRTLTIFNGRRFSQNTNMIPQAALARTEILKDGGAVIYGADATGGVVNFITRTDFDGLIADAEYKFIDGSDGDYNASVLWGKDFDNGNIMFSAEVSHRSELPLSKRDWAYHTYAENTSQYTPYANYSMYTLRNAAGGALGPVSDFTQAQCEQSGSGPVPGFFQANTFGAGLNTCWWNYPVHYIDIVDELDQVRTYLQVVNDLSDTVRFTASLAYGKSEADDISAVPGYNPNLGPAPAPGATNQFRVASSHPAFATFLAQNNVTTPGVAFADVTAPIFWGISGAPGWGDDGTTPTTQLENWNASAVLEGDFGSLGGGWLNTWKTSMTYNLYTTTTTQGDNVTYKIQEALNGFGGPNCHARDLVPDNFNIGDTNNDGVYTPAEIAAAREQFYATIGTQNAAEAGKNGCLYLNPFSNSFAKNAVFGGANPRYVAGLENDPALTEWIFDDRNQEDQTTNLTFDALVNGVTPINLAGGQVAWAAGAQWRQSEGREETTSPYLDPDVFPCQWPGQRPGQLGCSGVGESPYGFWTQDNQENTDQQQYSASSSLCAARSSRGLASAPPSTRWPACGIRCPGSRSVARTALTTPRRRPTSSPARSRARSCRSRAPTTRTCVARSNICPASSRKRRMSRTLAQSSPSTICRWMAACGSASTGSTSRSKTS
jgi:iron complex outermembrane recepter protein